MLLIAGGIGVRTFALSLSAVEHFDEGVYASNLFFGPPDYAYPLQALYAPPLVPALIEVAMLAGLPPNVAALLPAWLAGSGTLVILWWCVRRWIGPVAALACLALASCSDLHVVLSAAALTDGCLWLWVLLAVAAARHALLSGDLRWAVAGGLACGLAWWTKYNGWLPLAIVLAAAPLAWFVGIGTRAMLLRWLKVAAIMTIVAGLLFLPWLVSLQSIGGYPAVAANHARYVVGLTAWPDSVWRHLAQQRQLQSWLGSLGVAVAVLLASPTRHEQHAWGVVRHLLFAVAAGLTAWWLSTVPLLAVAAALGLARTGWSLYRRGGGGTRQASPSTQNGTPPHDSQVVTWSLIAAWWLGLLFATPCYTPYARLALGWFVASWLATGLTVTDHPSAFDRPVFSRPMGRTFGALLAALAVGIGVLYSLQVIDYQELMPSYLPRLGVRDTARQLIHALPNSPARVVYVYGDPAMFFQLRVAGEPLAVPVAVVPAQPAEIQGQPVPNYLVVSSYAQRDAAFQRLWPEHAGQWQLVWQHVWRPSAPVWLDWEDARQPQHVPTASVTVYRFRE